MLSKTKIKWALNAPDTKFFAVVRNKDDEFTVARVVSDEYEANIKGSDGVCNIQKTRTIISLDGRKNAMVPADWVIGAFKNYEDAINALHQAACDAVDASPKQMDEAKFRDLLSARSNMFRRETIEEVKQSFQGNS